MRLLRRGLVIAALAALAAPAAASGSAPQQAPATRQERLTSAETYVPMPTISAGVLQRNSTAGTIVVDMGLDVPDVALRRRVALNGPRLNDALRTAISTYATTYYRDRTAPDPVTLTRIMQQAVDRVLGAPGARALLANIIYQRRAS
ncbi:MAG: hypothetical protein ABL883_02335 [Terricaulis sp.]